MLNFPPAMDFSLSDHQLLIRDTVRDFMATEVRPHVKEWERTDHFPLDAIKKLGDLGCCGMLMPEEWGGPGLDTISYVLMLEEVARVDAAMATRSASPTPPSNSPFLRYGTEAQKSKYLRRLASGEILGSFCLTEPPQAQTPPASKPQQYLKRKTSRRALRLLPLATMFSTARKPGSPTAATPASISFLPKPIPSAAGKGITAFLVEPTSRL